MSSPIDIKKSAPGVIHLARIKSNQLADVMGVVLVEVYRQYTINSEPVDIFHGTYRMRMEDIIFRINTGENATLSKEFLLANTFEIELGYEGECLKVYLENLCSEPRCSPK